MRLRWFHSRTVREASYLCHRVVKVAHAQRDILMPQALESIAKAVAGVRLALANGADKTAISTESAALEAVANKWLKPYPYAGVRENVEVMLVALVVALGIRTFFLQPMAIPTGSMQPTLYGITHQDLRDKPGTDTPGALSRIFSRWFLGVSYFHVKAEEDGVFRGFEAPQTILPLIRRQRFTVGNRTYAVWFPPDKFEERSGLQGGDTFRKGDDIVKLKVTSGDRLFVDRVTFNFRRPRRGEIVIFASERIPLLTPDTHYIKRLVGLGGEKVRIGDDRHLSIDGRRVEASDPGFENVYSFHGPAKENLYSGHLNDRVGADFGKRGIAPHFPNEATEFTIPAKQCLFMGDNTMSSSDSRYFGAIPQDKIVGKCAFVFWPISSRFGWGFR